MADPKTIKMDGARHISGVFGSIPRDLAEVAKDAVQFSPLIPGAEPLAACQEGTLSGMVMLAPPGTLERRRTLALALKALRPGAMLTALAPKDKGGARLAKELASFGCEVDEHVKHHHRICRVARPETLTGLAEALDGGAMRFLPETGFWSQPGIFSWDRIDPGSALLASHLPEFTGQGADLGCGYGYLSREVLARCRHVERLTLIDNDGRAVEAAKRNVEDPRARFLWADLRGHGIGHTGLDFVIMNAPFHEAGTEDRDLAQLFVQRASSMLKGGGVCWLVANRHLPYEAAMAPLFETVKLVVEGQGFKVYAAQKSAKSQATSRATPSTRPKDKPPREPRRAKRYDANADNGDFDLEAFMREQKVLDSAETKPRKGKR